MGYEVHTHYFVSGPRSSAGYRNGVWCETDFTHSHEGGSEPHCHPSTGPSSYQHNGRGQFGGKFTKKPKGEQFELIPLTEEESSFTLVLTDSARINGTKPVGSTPIEALGFPAAERMMGESRLKCIVRDLRKGAR